MYFRRAEKTSKYSTISAYTFVILVSANNQKDQNKRPRDQRSPTEEKLSPYYKTARHHEDKMAELALEEDNEISLKDELKDIKNTLEAIQVTLGEVMSQNVQFRTKLWS